MYGQTDASKNRMEVGKMEIWSLVFSGVSALAAVVSAVTSIKTKSEIKNIKNTINQGNVSLYSEENKGNMVGVNSGEIK